MRPDLATKLAAAKAVKVACDDLRGEVARALALDPLDVLEPELVALLADLSDDLRFVQLEVGAQSIALTFGGKMVLGEAFKAGLAREAERRLSKNRDAAAAAAVEIAKTHAERAGRR